MRIEKKKRGRRVLIWRLAPGWEGTQIDPEEERGSKGGGSGEQHKKEEKRKGKGREG